jgi:hypothetical protein
MRARATKADQDAQQKSGLANFLSSRRIWCECPQTTDAVEKLDLRRFRDLIGKFPGRTYGSKSLISRQCSSGKKGASWARCIGQEFFNSIHPTKPIPTGIANGRYGA